MKPSVTLQVAFQNIINNFSNYYYPLCQRLSISDIYLENFALVVTIHIMLITLYVWVRRLSIIYEGSMIFTLSYRLFK